MAFTTRLPTRNAPRPTLVPKELITRVHLPLDDITSLNSQVRGGETMDGGVDAWVGAHAELIKRWTNGKGE